MQNDIAAVHGYDPLHRAFSDITKKFEYQEMVKIELNLNEGIVLFELLSRVNKSEDKITLED